MPCSETKPPGSHRGSFKRVNFERQLLCPQGLWARGHTRGTAPLNLPSSRRGRASPHIRRQSRINRLLRQSHSDTSQCWLVYFRNSKIEGVRVGDSRQI